MKTVINPFNAKMISTTICLSMMASGCGLIKTRDKDEASVQTIKRVAVVAFDVTQPASKKLSLNLSKGRLEGAAGGSWLAQQASHVDQLYADLGQSFRANLKWNVMKPELMKANPGYVKAYKDTMEGWQNKMPPAQGDNLFLVTGVMDGDALRILGPEGRDALIDALNVDAIITADIRTVIHGTSIMGIGAQHPSANLSFWIYTKGKEKPVWFEGQIEGDEAPESIGATGFINETLLNQLVSKSAKTAFAKIGQTKVD
jgi:hypothetical protein